MLVAGDPKPNAGKRYEYDQANNYSFENSHVPYFFAR
jgi:hypothetical protein